MQGECWSQGVCWIWDPLFWDEIPCRHDWRNRWPVKAWRLRATGAENDMSCRRFLPARILYLIANAFGLSGDSQRFFKITKCSALTEFDQCQRLGHSKDGCMTIFFGNVKKPTKDAVSIYDASISLGLPMGVCRSPDAA